MKRLGNSKLLNIVVLILYYLAVVLPHEQVGRAINTFFLDYSRSTYNSIIALLVLSLGMCLILSLYPSIKSHKDRPLILRYLMLSTIAVVLCFNILFVVNVEAIHFVQYAIFAIVLFPINKSAAVTISIATLAGGLDELYQYLFLADTNLYYDFNDVLLDTIGAGLGLLVLKIMKVETQVQNYKKWYQSTGFVLSIGVASLLLMAGIAGYFSINPRIEDPAYFTLFKIAPEGFWYYPAGKDAKFHVLKDTKFHVLRPIPGILLIYLTAYFYGRLDQVEPCS